MEAIVTSEHNCVDYETICIQISIKVVDAMINSLLIYQKDGCNTIGELVLGVMWTMTDCGHEQKFHTISSHYATSPF